MNASIHTDAELVEAYLENIIEGGGDTPHFWAFEEVSNLIHSDPERLWRITLQMLQQAGSPLVVEAVAGGPLEDLLCYHGSQFIERVENLAQTQVWFQEALRLVWGQNRMPPEIYSRVQRAIAVSSP